MTPTIQELVEPWFKIMTALDNAWDSWRDLGVGIEAPFPDAAWQLSGAYTKSVEMLLNHLWKRKVNIEAQAEHKKYGEALNAALNCLERAKVLLPKPMEEKE